MLIFLLLLIGIREFLRLKVDFVRVALVQERSIEFRVFIMRLKCQIYLGLQKLKEANQIDEYLLHFIKFIILL